MRKLLLMVLIFFSVDAYSQNKVYNLDKGTDSLLTNNTAVWQGKKYPVYSTPKGAIFIAVFSKTGKYYRKYIKQ